MAFAGELDGTCFTLHFDDCSLVLSEISPFTTDPFRDLSLHQGLPELDSDMSHQLLLP